MRLEKRKRKKSKKSCSKYSCQQKKRKNSKTKVISLIKSSIVESEEDESSADELERLKDNLIESDSESEKSEDLDLDNSINNEIPSANSDVDLLNASLIPFVRDIGNNFVVDSVLGGIWKSISFPVPEDQLKGKWYAVVYRNEKNNKKTLYIAKILGRFLLDEGGEIDKVMMKCLIPKTGSGDILCDTPSHREEEWDFFKMKQFIAGPLAVTPTPPNKFRVEGYEDIVKLFNTIKKFITYS